MTSKKETGAIHKTWIDQMRIALVYPNTYRVGMSNLGFQHVYHALNSSGNFVAERFFLDPAQDSKSRAPSRLLSVESSRPLRDFHLIAFSVPFENDYLNVPTILKMGSIQPLSRNRSTSDPIVMAGGVSVSMNPEPLASFMDFFYIGEIGDVDLPGGLFCTLHDFIIGHGADIDRESLCADLKNCPGVYIPGAYKFELNDDGVIGSVTVRQGYPAIVEAVRTDWDTSSMPVSVITTPDAEFVDTLLVETNRGCSRRCRFCAAGWIHSPVRYRSVQKIEPVIEQAHESGLRIGLVGSDLAGHPDLEKIIDLILSKDGVFSLSSIRPEGLSPFMIEALARTGQKTATLAPEAATSRMKEVIGKRIPNETFFTIIDRLVQAGIPNVRLYFMIGLPSETDEDIHAIVNFALDCRKVFVESSRKKQRIGGLSVQVNPFIPKPWTPFQWSAVVQRETLEARISILRKGLRNISNLSLRIEYGRDFFLQALLSRSDRYLGELLLGGEPGTKWTLQSLKKAGVSLPVNMYRERGQSEIFPWDCIDHGIPKRVLWKIYWDSLKSEGLKGS